MPLVQVLLAAGARIDVTCQYYDRDLSLHELLTGRNVRKDLGFLVERIEREHPEFVEKIDCSVPAIRCRYRARESMISSAVLVHASGLGLVFPCCTRRGRRLHGLTPSPAGLTGSHVVDESLDLIGMRDERIGYRVAYV